MSRIYLASPLGPLHNADGTTLTNTVTAADISPAPQIVPASLMPLEIGTEFELNAYGEYSSAASAGGNLTLGFYWGTVTGTAIAATTAVALATSAASWPWQLYYRGRIRTIGTSGTIKGEGYLATGTSLTAATLRYIPETQAGRTATIDTTAAGAKALTVGATFSVASASNIIICYDFSAVVTS